MRRAKVLLGLVLIAAWASVLRADPATNAIQVRGPRALPSELPCQRVPLGEADDYKPCMTRMADGTLLIVAFHQHKLEGSAVREDMLLFRSTDGGRSWFKEWRDFSEITAVAWTPYAAPVTAHPQSIN